MATENMRIDWAQKDFYGELGVTKTATHDEIKKAYRKLARANHPDSNPGDTAKHEKFKKVAEAYDVIGDEAKRKQYDEVRQAYAGGFAGGTAGGAAAASTSATCSASAAAASTTCSATSSAPAAAHPRRPDPSGARCRRRVQRHHRLRRRPGRRHDQPPADLRLGLPRLSRHRRQARHPAEDLPGVRGRGVRRELRRVAASR